MDIWHIERQLHDDGFKLICGVDEAGRGPLAGPVYAAAVVLPPNAEIAELGDSKKLSEKTRDRLFDEIAEKAVDYSIASASHKEIDEINILQATFLAMNRAIDSLKQIPDIALIDGNREPGAKCRTRCIVGGDGKSASIAAASILAKVSRDRYMADMALKYPEYVFEKHKGYGTKLHYERLREFGACEIHRSTFLKKWKMENDETKTETRGEFGERLARQFLLGEGYTIVSENFSSFFGEIDLIICDKRFIVFVEVKLRRTSDFAHAREFVTKSKQDKIRATASLWLASNKAKLQPRFDVIEIYAPDETATPEIIHIENAF